MSVSHFVAIITHGHLACEAKKVSDKLINPLDHVHCYSNEAESLEVLEEKIIKAIRKKNPQHILLISDLMGGSCWLLANRIKHHIPGATVLSGLNIPLLISYNINHEKMEWDELIRKIEEYGKKGIAIR
jgi:mannose/fructose-specific phosphotransferase system component IIA